MLREVTNAQKTKSSMAPDTENQAEIYAKDIITLEIVNLIMLDYDLLITDSPRLKDVADPLCKFVIACLFMLKYYEYRRVEIDHPTVKSFFLDFILAGILLGIAIGIPLRLLLELCGDYSAPVEQKAVAILKKNLHLFETESSDIIIFRRDDYGNQLKYSTIQQRFVYTKGTMQDDVNIKFQNSWWPHWNYVDVRALYVSPDRQFPHGRISNFRILADGSKNFSGAIALCAAPAKGGKGGEWLITQAGKQCSVLPVFQAIQDELRGIQLQSVNPGISEQLILSRLLQKTRELFKPNMYQPDYAIVDIAHFMNEKKGVCRHYSFLLAKLIQYAKDQGLLYGEATLRVRHTLGPGHAWLEYESKYTPKMLIDPVNNIKSDYKKSHCGVKLFFSCFFKPKPAPVISISGATKSNKFCRLTSI